MCRTLGRKTAFLFCTDVLSYHESIIVQMMNDIVNISEAWLEAWFKPVTSSLWAKVYDFLEHQISIDGIYCEFACRSSSYPKQTCRQSTNFGRQLATIILAIAYKRSCGSKIDKDGINSFNRLIGSKEKTTCIGKISCCHCNGDMNILLKKFPSFPESPLLLVHQIPSKARESVLQTKSCKIIATIDVRNNICACMHCETW